MIDNLTEAIAHAREVAKEKRELAKTICPWADDGEETLNECFECAEEHEQLASWLEELAERREADRWIPVSEPPKKEGKCFVFTDYGDVTMDSYIDGMFVCNLGNVTHWKPLPKAPESEEK